MPGARRTATDEAFLNALVCGATVEVAARKAEISRRTAYRRLQDPGFRKRLQDARAELSRRIASILSAGSLEAGKALVALISPSSPSATRLGAAKAIIELAAKLREAGETEERLVALEKRLESTERHSEGSGRRRSVTREEAENK